MTPGYFYFASLGVFIATVVFSAYGAAAVHAVTHSGPTVTFVVAVAIYAVGLGCEIKLLNARQRDAGRATWPLIAPLALVAAEILDSVVALHSDFVNLDTGSRQPWTTTFMSVMAIPASLCLLWLIVATGHENFSASPAESGSPI